MAGPNSSASASSTGKVLAPQSLAHVVLRTSNYKSMVSFYKAFLGAHAAYEDDHIAFLTYDEEHHRIAIAKVPSSSSTEPNNPNNKKSSSGLDHMAFSFATLSDLLQAYRQRKELYGIEPVWCVNHGITVSCYYQDPDGNRIETQVDVLTGAAADAFMKSAAFGENPIGADFDPEELLGRLESGDEDEAVLVRRADVGRRGLDSVPVGPAPEVRDVYEPLGRGHVQAA